MVGFRTDRTDGTDGRDRDDGTGRVDGTTGTDGTDGVSGTDGADVSRPPTGSYYGKNDTCTSLLIYRRVLYQIYGILDESLWRDHIKWMEHKARQDVLYRLHTRGGRGGTPIKSKRLQN